MPPPSLDDLRRQFQPDAPRSGIARVLTDVMDGRIEGCRALALPAASDDRGDLFELLTTRDEPIEPIVHVYQVFCAPGSIRAWVFHQRQADRLCFTQGRLRIALYDLRSDSPTAGALVTLVAGAGAPTFLRIPAFVAHGIQNLGGERTAFINMPTNVYRHDDPDKSRLPFDTPLIPFRW